VPPTVATPLGLAAFGELECSSVDLTQHSLVSASTKEVGFLATSPSSLGSLS